MKTKRIISAFLAVLMLAGAAVFSTTASAAEMPFSDVGKKKWFYDEVLYVYEKGLMTGTSETKFEPNASLTRAMFITILGRLAGAAETESNKFSDIKKKNWYSGYVGWAVDSGIVTGYEDGTFKPNKALTREEMAACISRYVDFMGIRMPRESTAPVEFADKGKIAKWARDYVEVLRRAGIANGDTAGKYNPKANITRAEMATVIMNLIAAEAKAWQGYEPDPADDGYAVYSAAYLYYNGTAVSGGMGTEIIGEGSGNYPYLSAFMDAETAENHSTPANSTGICTSVFEDLDLDTVPVVKIAYSYEGESAPEILTGHYVVNPCSNSWSMNYFNAYINEPLEFVAGADDNGYKTASFDLTALLQKHSHVNDDIDLSHILVEPFADGYAGEGKFNIRYIAFFKDQAGADAFESADLDDYMKNYFCFTSIKYLEYTDDVRKQYDDLLQDRIDDILNSEAEYTPEMIEANGGKCYYVSSIHGDDSNDGLSPETPWKSPLKLLNIKKPGVLEFSIPKAGDGVFFERGSVWYPEKYHNSSISTLPTGDGVIYSTYGEGPKPLFTCAMDFSEDNNVGVWLESGYENIWRLDIDRYVPEDWANDDVGNIFFNEGEAIGVRVVPASDATNSEVSPFGEGKYSYDYGLLSGDGKTHFMTGGTSLENVGTALKNNYEFFYDTYSDELWLYWDRGNPADSFDDIKVGRNGTAAWIANNTVIDNLAFMYSSFYAMRLSDTNITIQNCEIGCVGGEYTSVASGAELFGNANGIRMINNYVHDIADGPLSIQDTTDDQVDISVRNVSRDVELAHNVIVACGNGVELWIKPGKPIDGPFTSGMAQHYSENYNIHDNIMAYIGYGICVRQEEKRLGSVFCCGYEMVNSRLENNIVMYPAGQFDIGTFSSDTQKRGYEMINNTFIVNPEHCVYSDNLRDNVNSYWHHNLAGYGIGVSVPYEYRYLTYFANLGIGNGETYYHIDTPSTYEEENWSFFMTGKLVENLG